jgi:hypothetical protein
LNFINGELSEEACDRMLGYKKTRCADFGVSVDNFLTGVGGDINRQM